MSTEQFKQRYAELAVRYREQIVQCVTTMEGAVGVVEHGPSADHALQQIEREAHTLAGSAPTFGFKEVGEVAARLEDFARMLRERGAPLLNEDSAELRNLIMTVRAVATYV